MIITTKMLTDIGDCQSEIDLFQDLTGGSIDVTEQWCIEHYGKFDWDWVAENLLPATALVEYKHVRAQASAEYQRVIATAWIEDRRVRAQTFGRLLNAAA